MKNQHALQFRLKKHWSTLLLLLPAVVLGVVFSYVPMVGILMAFKTNLNLYIYEPFTAFLNAEWTLENFQIIFAGEEFLGVLWNTLYISVLKIVVLFPLPIIVSLLLTEVKNIRVSRMYQSLMYLPHFLSWSIITGIFMSVFATDGLVNNVLILFGMDASEAVNWYTDPSKFVFLVLFTDGWKGIGWSSIVYIAAINAISPGVLRGIAFGWCRETQPNLVHYLTVDKKCYRNNVNYAHLLYYGCRIRSDLYHA